MSNEITIAASLKLKNGTLKESQGGSNYKLDQTTANSAPGTQAIGTSEEAISYGDVATPGMALFENLGPTNFVEIGVKPAATFYPLALLEVGDPPTILKIADSIALYAKADTAGIKLKVLILAV